MIQILEKTAAIAVFLLLHNVYFKMERKININGNDFGTDDGY